MTHIFKNCLPLLVAGLFVGGCVDASLTASQAIASQPVVAKPATSPGTNWQVSHSMGLDALVFIGALSGDPMPQHHYQADIVDIRAKFSKPGIDALAMLDTAIRGRAKQLVGPTLALYFSASRTDTLDDLLATINQPETIQPVLEGSVHWDPRGWQGFVRLLPAFRTVVEELKRVGFEEKWRRDVLPLIEKRKPIFVEAVNPFDIIPEQRRLLGKMLDPTVEIIVLHYSKPYGIKIMGQRFLTHHEYSADTQLRIAAHEIFHPPFSRHDTELFGLLKPLEDDKWMRNIVGDHDPDFGYNSFSSVMNEDSTRALDQIVSERLGFARDPATRFVEDDDGMHMVAVAIYHAMKEDGFDDRGGAYVDWLKDALRRGLLTPDEVRRRAALVVGQDTVSKWDY